MPPANKNLDVDFGDEYDLDLSFDASTLTLVAVPEPSATGIFIGIVLLGVALHRRRA